MRMEKAPSDATFTRRVLIVALIVAGVVAVWLLSPLLLLIFGSILVALTLRSLAQPFRMCGVGETAAVALAAVLCCVTLALAILFFGAEMAVQSRNLNSRLGASLADVAEQLGIRSGEDLLKGANPAANFAPLIPRFVSWGWSLGQAILAATLVVVAGLYLAVDPKTYRDGLVTLVPRAYQDNAVATLDDIGKALHLWLGGMLISMTIVGSLTGTGLWLVGIQSPLALGLLAGLANFVPYVGSIVAAGVTLVMSSGQGWEFVAAAAGVMLIVQQIESHVITPLVVGRAVSILPATGLFAIVAMAILFGPMGVLFGFPLAIVTDIAIRRLYVRDALDQPVEILGNPAARSDECAAL